MDEVEFDDFYAASYARVVGQVHAMIGSRDEAEECVQEAFARAWAHRRRLSAAEHPEAWVRTTAHRLAVSRWRRVVRGRRPADRAVATPVTAPPPDERRVALLAALARLPEDQRRALVLHHLADLPVREVAREVGAPEGTVKARLSRGRTALGALLADEPDTQHEGAHRG
ncbi:RNA polymerase sigma factor [Nocardioides bruguierae]|uniref:Sigma-70 family RNA polymerase sigma factor n=1 Tax=Nocardioides bruguierae TaxID=2945102 RepID=A0A9X2D8B7_9ACTN|nr:sigma-70 family RNA polymerase sigma factor [Nocardioides bruguierae]MCM0621238.1 sigma-70 family RNA polymerase sigma factor [Nocardioides bruguierae]